MSKRLFLKRVAQNEQGTWGVLIDGNMPFALTLERPWLDNQRSVSCIPAGMYVIERVVTPKHGETFQIKDVPNRTAILFHPGNFMEDSEGCVLTGERFDYLGDRAAVLDSKKGFSEFMERMAGHKLGLLHIEGHY